MLANNPQLLVKLCFLNLHSFISAKLCFAENTIKMVFSAEHSFCVSRIVEPPFEAPSQNGTWFQKCHFEFSPVSAEALFLQCLVIIRRFCMVTKKCHFPKTDSCSKNVRFLPSEHKWCLPIFLKCHFCKKNFLVHNHPKHYFFQVSFSIFFIFSLFLSPT